MPDKKFSIKNVNSTELYLFLKNSFLAGDQTLDIKRDKIYCKASNKSKTNILYRHIAINSDGAMPKEQPDHCRFFIQNYEQLSKIVKFLRAEEFITLTFQYDDELLNCKKVTFSNKNVNFDVYASEYGMSDNYIDDEKWEKISKPTEPTIVVNLDILKIKEILNLHSLSKSDTEKMNIMTISSENGKFVMKHKTFSNELEFSFCEDSGLVSNSLEGEWKVSLDVFNNIEGYNNFTLMVNTKGIINAMYLTSGNNITNITSLTNG